MREKTKQAYTRMFSVVKVLIGNVETQTALFDFEIPAIDAFTGAFRQTQAVGCAFHFGQCIWRHVQSFCLSAIYMNEPAIKTQVRSLIALSYAKVEHVCRIFDEFELTEIHD
jgi:hypothetical protein